MENNALTPSPAPTPNPGTNMPEFATSPTTQQTPVLPPVSSMPAFGGSQAGAAAPAAQPQSAQEPVQEIIKPIAPVMDAPAPVAQEPVVPELETVATEQPQASLMPLPDNNLGQITTETQPASEVMPEAQNTEPQTQTIEQLVAEANQNQSQTMAAPEIPENKKSNVKLFALIGGLVLVICGGIVGFMLLNQPKQPENKPEAAPVVTNVGPDTSTPFEKLTADQAKDFLEATADYKTYFPEDYTEEDDMTALDDSKSIALFYSYEEKKKIIDTLKTSPVVETYRDKLSSSNVTIDQTEDYAMITIDSEAVKCKDVCYGLIFNKNVLNYSNEIVTNPSAGINLDHIMLTKHTEKDIKRLAPLVAAVFMNGQKIYSTEFKSVDDNMTQFIVNTVEYQPEDKKTVQTKQTFFTVNKQTGEMLFHPDMTVTKVLEDSTSESELEEPSTDEE